MPSDKQQLLNRLWPGVLMFVALFPTLFITQAAYAELAISVLAFGLIAGTAIPFMLGRPIRFLPGVSVALGLLLGYLALRSLFVAQPMIAFGGAWTSDGTVFSVASIVAVLLCTLAWASSTSTGDRATAFTPLLIAITLIATTSSIAAWQWGSTDPSGGPASGFTANSQLQLQLLTTGFTAALAWASLRRREVAHVISASVCAFIIFVGMLECRSSVMLPSLGLGVAYALTLLGISGRLKARSFALLTTALTAAAHIVLATLLLHPASAGRVAVLLDSLGNGRGMLWAGALQRIAQNPFFGRAPGHSAGLSSWRIDGPSISYVSTADPHSLVLTLAAAGGVIAIGLLFAAVYFLQRDWFRVVRVSTDDRRVTSLVIVGGGVMLFALGQFTFVFTLAWVLMAAMVGLLLGWSADFAETDRRPLTRVVVATSSAVVVLLIALVWVTMPGRADSTAVLLANLSSPPAVMLEQQLGAIRRPWDLVPAEYAAVYLRPATEGESSDIAVRRAAYDEAMKPVDDASATDTRMIAAKLRVWVTDAERGDADLPELDRIVKNGIASDPGLGLWRAAGAAFSARYGGEEQARVYATSLRGEVDQWRQTQASCDPLTLKLLRSLMSD